MYQYVLANKSVYPFSLFIRMPRQEFGLSNSNDLISIYPLKDALIIVEHLEKENVDLLLDNLDEVCICICITINSLRTRMNF